MSLRSSLTRAIFSLNVLVLLVAGLGFSFAPTEMVKGANEASRGSVRAFGALQLAYGLLLLSLGAAHHGGYCITMTWHGLVAGLFAAEANAADQRGSEGEANQRFVAVAAYHAVMAVGMLGMLVTGGIGVHAKASSSSSSSSSSTKQRVA